jgi:hypothetical protein
MVCIQSEWTDVSLLFDNGISLHASYWRFIDANRQALSSFDHGQKYGLDEPIDAIKELALTLRDKVAVNARHDVSTGDLILEFSSESRLQILNVTAYEIWTILFPNGATEYSNYNR